MNTPKEYTVCHKYLEEAANESDHLWDILSKIASRNSNMAIRLNERIEDIYNEISCNDKYNIISTWWLHIKNLEISKIRHEYSTPPDEDLASYDNKLAVHYLHVASKSNDYRNMLIIREERDYLEFAMLVKKYRVKTLDKRTVYNEFS